MSVFRAKLWTGVGAAMVLGAGLAACSGGDGEGAADPAEASSSAESGEGGESGAATPPADEGGEGGGEGEGGAAAGERGAAPAYAAVPADSRTALRVAQLKGFFQAAKAVGAVEGAEAASALAGQGMLEVYEPARAEFASAGLNEASLRKAVQTGEPGALDAALASFDSAQKRAGGDPAAVARGLSALTVGLYRETTAGGALDPIEYQHSYAAALALQSLAGREAKLSPAKADIDRLARLWPSPVAPEQASQAPTLAQVQAQASRIELALSGA